MREKFKKSDFQAISTVIMALTFITSLLTFMAIVSNWIPPVAGIVMELSVIMFVMVVSGLFAIALTAVVMIVFSLISTIAKDIALDLKIEKAKESNKKD